MNVNQKRRQSLNENSDRFYLFAVQSFSFLDIFIFVLIEKCVYF